MKKLKTLLAVLFIATVLISCSKDDDSKNDNSNVTIPAGSIIISEIMNNPSAVNDTDGEWFEVYNTSSDKTYELKNFTFSNGSTEFTVNTTLNIEPNSYLIFSNNNDFATNGGVNSDYTYSNFALGNSGGKISITNSSKLIDSVNFNNFTLGVGKSLSLNPNKLTSSDNDIASNWCLATSQILSGDFGTPDTSNDNCN